MAAGNHSSRDRRRLVFPGRSLAGSAFLLAAGLVLVLVLLSVIPGFPSLNPFATDEKDRSQPVVIKSLTELKEYRAASAQLQVLVDIEKDAKYLPGFIKGERVLFVAQGNVDAKVDFSGLSGKNLEVSEDRRSVRITLPPPELTDAVVDPDKSQVVDNDRGVLNRIGDAFGENSADEQKLFARAKEKLAEAARADPDLLQAAERNTRDMLVGLMKGLGFTNVTVVFSERPPL